MSDYNKRRNEHIAEAIKQATNEWCRKNDKNLGDFAKSIKMDPSQLSFYRSGKQRPSARNYAKIATACGCDPLRSLEEKDREKEEKIREELLQDLKRREDERDKTIERLKTALGYCLWIVDRLQPSQETKKSESETTGNLETDSLCAEEKRGRKPKKAQRENNKEIRDLVYDKHLLWWEVADRLGISEATLHRKLRNELPAEEKGRWLKLIEEAEK